MLLWPFNKYPGTDYETYNWDWLIGLGKKLEKALYDLFSDTGALHQMVDKVLDEHPEWTTTVMDGAITESKINSQFLERIKNPYVTPMDFDAVGDGVTDDHESLTNCFAYAAENGLIAYIPEGETYGWNSPVFMPSGLHLIIDGELRAIGNAATFNTFDGVNGTPGYTASHDIVVEGYGVVNMQGNILTTTNPTPFRIHHAKQVTIKDITIKDCSQYHAIECGGTDGLLVENVKFVGMHANGASGKHEFVQLERINDEGTTGAIPYDGTPAINVIIRDCYFGPSDNGGECFTAVGVHDSTEDYIENVIIENCIVKTSVVFAFAFSGKVKNLTIRNCNITRKPYGGTASQPTLAFENCINVIIDGNTFGDCYGRHIVMGSGASTTFDTNITIKNNIFNEYGVNAGDDLLGIFINCRSENLKIVDNIFKSSIDNANRPIHIGMDTLNNYTTNLDITGNVFYSKVIDMSNYQRWNKLMGRTTLYSGNAAAENTYTLTDNVGKYDMLEIRFARPNTSTMKRFTTAAEGGISENLEYYWMDADQGAAQNMRLLVTFEDDTMTIGRNQATYMHFSTSGGSKVIDYVLPERISVGSPTMPFLSIGKVVGINNNNKIVYVN